MISTLNVINEAEINYKAARNNRLHVELALIKLCYLQQAIEISSDTGGVSKKKLVESSLAFRTAAIKPLKNEKIISNQQLIVSSKQSEAKLVIETSTVKEEKPTYKAQPESEISTPLATGTNTQTTKLSALDKIRKQVKGSGNNGNDNNVINKPLVIESLQAGWNEYAQ